MHPEETTPLIPRMGLKHLMLWMFVTAAIVGWAMNNFGARGTRGLPEELVSRQLIVQVTMSVVAIGVGALFTAAITLLVACVQHQRLVMHAPGHWFAVAKSLGYVWSALSYLTYSVLSNTGITNYPFFMVIFSLGGLLQAIVYAGAWRQQAASRWRWLFGWAAITEVGIFLAYVALFMLPLVFWFPIPLTYLFSFSKELIVFVAIIACLVEALKGVRRDWAHTVSIIGMFIVALTSFIRLFAFFLLPF